MPLITRAPATATAGRTKRSGGIAAALAIALAFAVVLPLGAPAPAAAVDGARPAKQAPTRVTPYRPGATFTADTDVRSASGYSAWLINAWLAANTPLPPIGAAFVEAERKTGVNALYFLAHAMLESGFGGSAIAQNKRNLFGYNAFDRDPSRYASAWSTFEEGVLFVAEKVRDDYLTPGARFWGGYPTLRAMNLCYASDPGWADKIASIANRIEAQVATLRERGIRFRGVALAASPVVATATTLTVRWSGRGSFPRAIGFAVRWVPLAVTETARTAPKLRAPEWTTVRRTGGGAGTIRLRVTAPKQPGLWRLDVRALDEGGAPLPEGDNPAVPSMTVRVAGKVEGSLQVSLGSDGRLTVAVRSDGSRAIAATGKNGGRTALEAWILPLDGSRPATRIAIRYLGAALKPGARFVATATAATVRSVLRGGPVVVVARLAGEATSVGRAVPAVALLTAGAKRPVLTPVRVADPRTTAALARAKGTKARPATPGPLALGPASQAGQVTVRVDAAVVSAAADYLPGAPEPAAAPAPGTSAAPETSAAPDASAVPGTSAAPDATSGDLAGAAVVTSGAGTSEAAPVAEALEPTPAPTPAPPKGRSGIGGAVKGRPATAAGATSSGAARSSAGTPSVAAVRARDPEQATILVRSLAVGGGAGSAAPDLVNILPDADVLAKASFETGVVALPAGGLTSGVRLVIAALLEPGARSADPSTLVAAWLPVSGSAAPAPEITGDSATR